MPVGEVYSRFVEAQICSVKNRFEVGLRPGIFILLS